MILTELNRAFRELPNHPLVLQALDFLRQATPELAPGRYDLHGEQLYASVARYQTRLPDQAVWESHRKYIDLQYVVTGRERVGYEPLNSAPAVQTPYQADRDVQFYSAGHETFAFRAGQLAVFFPEDIHAPNLAEGSPDEVLKIVVKLHVEGWPG